MAMLSLGAERVTWCVRLLARVSVLGLSQAKQVVSDTDGGEAGASGDSTISCAGGECAGGV